MQISNELADTIQRYESYAVVDPQNYHLAIQLGDLYHRAGSLADASTCFERSLLLQPGFAPARSRLAAVMLSQHRFADAERTLRALLEEGESSPALQHNLGIALYYQGHWSDAGTCFSQAAAAGLKEPSNSAYLARTLHHLGMMNEAIEACHQWQAAAQSHDSQAYLALLYLDNGDIDDAFKLAAQILEADPDHAVANVVAGSALLDRLDYELSRRHFEAVIRQDAKDGRAWQGMGLLHLQDLNYAEAIAALEKASEIFPGNVGNAVTLGWTKLVADDVQGAEHAFEHALEINRSFGEAHGGLAVALALQGKIEQAEQAIKLADRLNPQGFGADYARATLAAVAGNEPAATAIVSELLGRSPRDGMPSLMSQVQKHLKEKNLMRP